MLTKTQHIIIKLIDWSYNLIPFVKKIIPHDLFTYGFTGGLNMLFDICLWRFFFKIVFNEELVSIFFITMSAHIAAFVFVFPITFTTGFLLAKYITFKKSDIQSHKQLFRYAISVIGSIILHYFLLKFFIEYLGFWGTVSKILTVAIVTIYSFLMQKFFTFRTRKTANH